MGITKQDQIASLHVEMLKEQLVAHNAMQEYLEDEAIEQQIEDGIIEGTA